VVALNVVAAGHAGRSTASLWTQLDRALSAPGVSRAETGAVVIDLETGDVVYARNATRPLLPASTEKLAVAVAVLVALGPGYRLDTDVLGDGVREGPVWAGDLFLKGYGDPTLRGRDLVGLARQVRSAGIRRVTGGVLGDESYFDGRRTAPGWKRSFYGEESPPLSALVINRATVRGRWADNPALAAAAAFEQTLERAGVRVAGRAATGVAPPSAVPLAGVLSEPLARMVQRMNRESDNFVAEILLKTLGASAGHGGSTAAGAQVVRRVLAELGVPLRGVRLADGSGLSRGDRLTASALSTLLVAARKDSELAGPLMESLAVAGVNGTLEDRLDRRPTRGRVFAKTGTTDLASSLAGFVGERYAFAVIMNGRPIPWWAARQAQDRFVELLAAQ
jgi:D-alanyl-D-alanine carboxypeptidase/D-alanyl-D-alanine-endopeptidase (penicillin-binding protein 4)